MKKYNITLWTTSSEIKQTAVYKNYLCVVYTAPVLSMWQLIMMKNRKYITSEEDRATGAGNMRKNLAKFVQVVFELRERTDKQTYGGEVDMIYFAERKIFGRTDGRR